MYLYIIFGVLTFLSLLEVGFSGVKYSTTKIYSGIFWIFILVFILFSSFRWERGTDWESYLDYFRYNKEISTEGFMEPGFTLFTTINHVISDGNYTFQLTLLAVITIFLKAFIIKKYSIYPFLTLLVWFSVFLCDIFPVRQTMAVSITFFSLIYIVKRKLIPFILCVILASTIHMAALFFLPAYYFFHCKFKRSTLIFTLILVYAFAFIFSSIILEILDSISPPLIRMRIEKYLEDGQGESYGSLYNAKQILLRGLINKLIILVPAFTYLWSKYGKDYFFRGLLNIIFFGTILTVLGSSVNIALSRLGVYSDIVMQILFIPYLLKIKVNQRSRILLFLILCIYLFYRFNGVVLNYKDLYIPYQSIFDL